MAQITSDSGLPGELPVMASLVDSGLRNLPQGDATTAGYFQMRVDIWNSGDYAGFPDYPVLQLQWFIDQAQAVRQQQVAAGDTSFGEDPDGWGDWVADVQRPADQYRYRYQLRLDDARALIASGCAQSQPPPPAAPGPAPFGAPDSQLIPDSVLPSLTVQARKFQEAGRTGVLSAAASCSNESCLARAGASIAVPGKGVFRMTVAPVQLRRDERISFRFVLSARLRKLVALSVRKRACPLAAIRAIAANAGGYRTSVSRTVRVARNARACG